MPVNLPEEIFAPPSERDESWPDFPELRRAVEWLKTFILPEQWKARRMAAAERLYGAALGETDASGKGRFFSEGDVFAWYLFLGEAYLDHAWNYEQVFGSRVVPILAAIGRNLDLLRAVDGVDERVARLVGSERRQPNGALFELLVAGAYCRAGARVAFCPEMRGVAKTHDMDVLLGGREFAVECKRMEVGEYGERERARMRQLWADSSTGLAKLGKSAFCHVRFTVPIEAVPPTYLTEKTLRWFHSAGRDFRWKDNIGTGEVRMLDLGPLTEVLAENDVLTSSARMLELLTGEYVRHGNYIQVADIKPASNPRYVDSCRLAIVLHWISASSTAVDAKARDIFGKLAEAARQLPDSRPGIVHIGFEAVEGDDVEKARYEKIIRSSRRFDPGTKPLEYVYCHYFVPDAPPDQAWAFDETTQWCAIRPKGPHPLGNVALVLPEHAEHQTGAFWESKELRWTERRRQ